MRYLNHNRLKRELQLTVPSNIVTFGRHLGSYGMPRWIGIFLTVQTEMSLSLLETYLKYRSRHSTKYHLLELTWNFSKTT